LKATAVQLAKYRLRLVALQVRMSPKRHNTEEHGLRVFHNIILREISLPKREKISG
jgi:hypothetical protein